MLSSKNMNDKIYNKGKTNLFIIEGITNDGTHLQGVLYAHTVLVAFIYVIGVNSHSNLRREVLFLSPFYR